MFTISQKTQVYTYEYPYAKSLNPKLHRIIFEKAVNENMGAAMTDWNCFNIKEFKLISLNIDPNLRPSNLTPDHYLELAMETE